MKFKNQADENDFQQLNPRLKTVVDFMAAYAQIVLSHELTVTRIVERPTADKKSDTHDQYPPYRFIDIRSKDLPPGEAEKLRHVVNFIFPYGLTSKGKPTDTILPLNHAATSANYTGEHFHVQVSSRSHFG